MNEGIVKRSSRDLAWMLRRHPELQPGMLRHMTKLSEDPQGGCSLLRVEGAAWHSIPHAIWEVSQTQVGIMKCSLNPHICIIPAPHSYTISLHNHLGGGRGRSQPHPSCNLAVISPQFWPTLPRSMQGTPGDSQSAEEALEPLPALFVLYAT